MKRIDNIYNKITNINNIMDIYDREVRKNTKNKKRIEEFDNYYSVNINSIREELKSLSYIPGEYNIFFIINIKNYLIIYKIKQLLYVKLQLLFKKGNFE